jgi:predicted nucleic acid-binding protein
MKVFLDTNVILEFFLEREEFSTVHLLFKKLFEQSCIMFMSVGSYYTMIFLVDKYLRKEH